MNRPLFRGSDPPPFNVSLNETEVAPEFKTPD